MKDDIHTAPKSESDPDQDLASLRSRKIQDFLNAAVQDESPLRANLRAEAAELMATGRLLDEAIKQTLVDSRDTLRQFEKVRPLMDAYLRYTKMWSRLIEIDQRVAKSN